MTRGIGCVVALLIALLIFGGWFVSTRNSLVTLDESVNQQWAQVESVYQRGAALIQGSIGRPPSSAYCATSRSVFCSPPPPIIIGG